MKCAAFIIADLSSTCNIMMSYINELSKEHPQVQAFNTEQQAALRKA